MTDPELKERLESLSAENQKLLSLISHDIKGPLNRVFALMQLLQMDSENFSPDQNELLQKMHLVVADGMAMLRNLVDYRNLEYKDIELMPERINLHTLLNTAIHHAHPIAERKKIRIEKNFEDTEEITADRQSLLRIADNLLSNAIKFSTPDKTVSIILRNTNPIEISLHDQAQGFTPADLEKMYGKFTPLSARPTGGESTTGLGLYIAKKMAEKNGWALSVKTTEGIGSTFTLLLPAY